MNLLSYKRMNLLPTGIVRQRRRTTKFIIAQRVSSVSGADRILVLDDGVISGFDTHENLLKTNPIYQDVYESQTSGNGDFDEGSDH